MESLKKQVGGNHYKGFEYQPVEFYHKANIPANLAFAIKYIIREKNDKIEDFQKAIHMIELHVDLSLLKLRSKKVNKKELTLFLNKNGFDELVRFSIINIVFLMSSKKKKHLKKQAKDAIQLLSKMKDDFK